MRFEDRLSSWFEISAHFLQTVILNIGSCWNVCSWMYLRFYSNPNKDNRLSFRNCTERVELILIPFSVECLWSRHVLIVNLCLNNCIAYLRWLQMHYVNAIGVWGLFRWLWASKRWNWHRALISSFDWPVLSWFWCAIVVSLSALCPLSSLGWYDLLSQNHSAESWWFHRNCWSCCFNIASLRDYVWHKFQLDWIGTASW